jgi:hypothetical protein
MTKQDGPRRVFASHRARQVDGDWLCETCRVPWPCQPVQPYLRDLLGDDSFTFE